MCKSTAVKVAILAMAADWLIVKHIVSRERFANCFTDPLPASDWSQDN
jgi:hypothetical protein